MTDLVQKIAEAVNAAWDAWADDTNDERPFIVVQREAIRAALADAGEPVAWGIRPSADSRWHVVESEKLADMARERGLEVSPIYTHPAPGRVAELEAQCNHLASALTESREREGRMYEAFQRIRSIDNGAAYRIASEAIGVVP